jgi:jumonji domain-containing protein 2
MLTIGAAKSWYAVPADNRQRFENLAASYFTTEERDCKEYLRHKTIILNPARLKDCALPYTMAVQEAGEFIITFPGAYHAGFNHGIY